MSSGPPPPGTAPPVRPREIVIVPVGALERERELLAWLAEALAGELGTSVAVGERMELRDEWRCAQSGQVNSNGIVDELISRDAPGDEPPDRWVLGVTDADLFAPGRAFVFGEAAQGGAWAVIGLARLRGGAGLGDASSLRRRVLTEAVHELGHLWGLEHCASDRCVMYPSRTLEDTDWKGSSPCPACDEARRALAGVDREAPRR